MSTELDNFIDYVFSQTEPALFDRPATYVSTEAFTKVLQEEVLQYPFLKQLVFRMVIAGLEQRLPTIMSRSLIRLDVTPKAVWVDILEGMFSRQNLTLLRRDKLPAHVVIKIAGHPYSISLIDGGPTSVLETIVFPKPPTPILSEAQAWPTKMN